MKSVQPPGFACYRHIDPDAAITWLLAGATTAERDIAMADANKTAEIARRIQDLSRKISTHQSTIARIEKDKNEKMKYCDQQIQRERDEIARLEKQVADLKRQM